MKIDINSTYKNSLLALISGSALTLAFAPFNLWIIAIISPCFLYYLLQQENYRCRYSTTYGLSFFLAATSWVYVSIHYYGNSTILLAALLTFLFAAYLATYFFLFGLAYVKLSIKSSYIHNIILFAGLWTIIEYLRGIIFTGFPWAFLGTAHLNSPLQGFVPIIGVYGLTFLSLIISLMLYHIWQFKRRQQVYLIVILLIIFLTGIKLSDEQWTTTTKQSATVALVQGNIDQNEKWQAENQDSIISTYLTLTNDYKGTDIIIWPEAAVTIPLPYSKGLLKQIAGKLAEDNSTFITGVLHYLGDKNFNNTIYLDDGNIYAKTKLVPFGEFVPFETILRGVINFLDLPMSSITAGNNSGTLLQIKNIKFKPAICYEIAYPQFMLENVAEAGAILTISNDTWFGDSIGPRQHLQLAQMRALETGRMVVRASNNGVTAIIDHKGKIITEIPGFIAAVLKSEVYARSGKTPIMIVGHYTVLITILLILIITVIRYRLKK